MHPLRPPIPPKPRLPGLGQSRDFRDSGISVSDDSSTSMDSLKRTISTSDTVSTPGTPSAVRQLASRFETIALRQSSPNLQRTSGEGAETSSIPRKLPTKPMIQQLQTKVESCLQIAPKPQLQPILPLSAHDRSYLSQRASAIAERIYDTVYER
uniref:Uncharacterized protein n=1 Tax=Anopheles maculatus TaxID=74869 RepID=A0A182T9U8_9DIPT